MNKGSNGGMDVAKDALKRGALKGSVSAVNRRAVKALVDKLGPGAPEVLRTRAGEDALMFILPMLMLTVLDNMPDHGHIPEHVRGNVRTVLGTAMEGAASHGMQDLVDAVWDLLGPAVQEFIGAAETLQLPDLGPVVEVPEGQRIRDRVHAAV